jgi:hypothetical protein
MSNKINIGDLVKDAITGVSGVTTAYSICLNNVDRFSIQRLAEEGEKHKDVISDSYWFDAPQVVLIQKDYLDKDLIVDCGESQVQLGDDVSHIFTGYEGYVTQIAYWISGCIRVGVQSRDFNKDGQLNDLIWFSDKELKITKAFNQEDTNRKVGGPMPIPQKVSNPKR